MIHLEAPMEISQLKDDGHPLDLLHCCGPEETQPHIISRQLGNLNPYLFLPSAFYKLDPSISICSKNFPNTLFIPRMVQE